MNTLFVSFLALFSGGALAVMISLNSRMALFVTPLYASWVAHGVGAITAFFLVKVVQAQSAAKALPKTATEPSPVWSYLGGLPGAFVVILGTITVNSPLGLTGTLVLTITGQVVFGLLSDQWGWFGMAQRKINWRRVLILAPIILGSLLIITAKG